MDVPRRGHAPHRGARGRAARRRATTCACSRRSIATSAAPRFCTAARARRRARRPTGWCRSAARSAGRPTAPSRTSRGTPHAVSHAAPRAARRPLRRRARARAGRAGRRLGRADAAPTRRWSARSTATPRAGRRTRVAALLGARRKLNRLTVRIAVSEAAAWTGRRFYGGRYRVVPNGVALPEGGVPAPRAARAGRAAADRVRRPGRRAQGPAGAAARLRGAARPGPRRADDRRRRAPTRSRRCWSTAPASHALGRVDDDARARRAARRADVLCAPSLGGESFGMVLTEAFAAGTPVVASDIAGYRDVVTDGVDGLLVPRGDATRAGRDAARPRARSARARARWAPPPRAAPSATPGRASPTQVVDGLRGRARACRRPRPPRGRAAVRIGALPADGGPRVPARAAARRSSRRPRARPRGARASPAAPALGVAALAAPSAARCSRSSGSASTRSATRSCARARPGCSSAWR